MRLNKAISDTGFCSRREADKYIEQNRVHLNGRIGVLGDKVSEGDKITIDGKPIKEKEKSIYIAFNKPRGITCTTELNIKDNIMSSINHPKRTIPIGRLDKASEGLIFLTNDGDIVNKILRAGNNHEKEYIVTLNKSITPEFIQKMSTGVPILDTVTKKCIVKKINNNTFSIVLTQGLNRQIRRMCEYLNYEVTRLQRIRIINVTLKSLPIGKWRNLTTEEMDEINKLVANSIKTEEASR